MSNQLPQLGHDGLILEGICSTYNADGSVNISPMGPIVEQSFNTFVFRPYQTSQTYRNLKRTGTGAFHVTDDVGLFAQAALGQPNPLPAMDGLILLAACRWYLFEVDSIDDTAERTTIVAHTATHGQQRELLGFNRAKHAVIEAAILATRVDFLPIDELLSELERLKVPVEKTGSSEEHRAFDFLRAKIDERIAQRRAEELAS